MERLPFWKDATSLLTPLTSDSPSSTEGTTSMTSMRKVTNTAASDSSTAKCSLEHLITPKHGHCDDGATDDWQKERLRNDKAPPHKGSDHCDPNNCLDRAVDKNSVANGRFWACHEVALMRGNGPR